MRLAILTPHLSRKGGGLFSAVQSLSRGLSEHVRQLDIRIFGLLDDTPEPALPLWEGLDVVVFKAKGLKLLRNARGMLEEIRAFRPDVIHTHGLWSLLSIVDIMVDRHFEIPRIVSPHGMLDPWALRQRRIKKALGAALVETRHLRAARCLNATAVSELESIRKYGLSNPTCVVPNAVEVPARWRGAISTEDGELPAKEHFVLAYLGRFHPKKGLAKLLRGWALARKRNSAQSESWRLVIAGSGDENHLVKLKGMINELGIAGSVEMHGPKYGVEKDAFLENADALVLPSESEGLPMIVIEAWARGVPALVTSQSNVPEGAAHNAALEVGTDPESIANGIDSFMKMSLRQRRAMGIAARNLAETRFGTNHVARAMHEVYLWMVSGGAPPSSMHVA